MDYIKRETILNALSELKNSMPFMTDKELSETVKKKVEKIPAEDVQEVKHGKWIIHNDRRDWQDPKSYMIFIECSECGKSHFLGTNGCANSFNCEELRRLGNSADYNYCGKCGAKMDKE